MTEMSFTFLYICNFTSLKKIACLFRYIYVKNLKDKKIVWCICTTKVLVVKPKQNDRKMSIMCRAMLYGAKLNSTDEWSFHSKVNNPRFSLPVEVSQLWSCPMQTNVFQVFGQGAQHQPRHQPQNLHYPSYPRLWKRFIESKVYTSIPFHTCVLSCWQKCY